MQHVQVNNRTSTEARPHVTRHVNEQNVKDRKCELEGRTIARHSLETIVLLNPVLIPARLPCMNR